MTEIQYLDYDGLQRYHELIDAKKADKSQISDVLRYSSQSLSSEQKAQARTNIGATDNVGTITGITMNGASKGTSGVIDLGTVITAHQDISGKVDTSTTVNGHALTSNITVTKSDIGLGSVTNDAQVKRSEMGVASGVATLDTTGKVPSSQLPSYVDDVIEAYYKAADGKFYTTLSEGTYSNVITGETGKIYVDLSTSRTYRWGGSAYAEIKASPGTLDDITDGTTYVRMTASERNKLAGIATGANVGTITGITMNGVSKGTSGVVDLGTVITAHQDISGKADKSATVSTVTYDTTNKKFTKTINGTTTDIVTVSTIKTDLGLTSSDVGLGNVGNFKAVSTVASQGLSSTEQANARANIGAGTSSFSGSYSDLTNKPSTITHGTVGSATLDSTKQIDALFVS